MKRWEKMAYVGTPEPMGPRERYLCQQYVKRKQEVMFLWDRFLIDSEALLRPFHLDCANCATVHRETCCDNGQPYPVEAWQGALIERVSHEIAERYWSDERRQVCGEAIWDRQETAGTPRSYRGNCLFATDIGGVRCCALHAFAEAEGQDVYLLKPISCQLYPLDLIELDGLILITALSEETAGFSRWADSYLDHFYCANQSRRKQASHLDPQLFSLEGYRPAYEWGQLVLERLLGTEVFTRMKQVLSESRIKG